MCADLPGPRREAQNKRHPPSDVLALATGAVIGGAEAWDGIAVLGRAGEAFPRRLLKLGHGIPSPGTLARVPARLAPTAFAAALGRWPTAAPGATGRAPVAIGGASAGGPKKATATGCLRLASAWATGARLTRGRASGPEGSSAGAVAPEVPAMPELKGAVVALDAAGCRGAVARQIRDPEGGYPPAVEGNQPALHAAVGRAFAAACEADFGGAHAGHPSGDSGRGRAEERYVAVSPTRGGPSEWPGVAAVVPVNRERAAGRRAAPTTASPATAGRRARSRAGHAGADRAMARKVAVSLARRAPGKQGGVTKRPKAGWDDYMSEVLQGIPAIVVR